MYPVITNQTMHHIVVVFFTLTDRASTIQVIYVVANPVLRDLLGRKRSEEHLLAICLTITPVLYIYNIYSTDVA